MTDTDLTKQEEHCLNLTVKLWDALQFMQIEGCHKDDNDTFKFHIHAIQALIMCRPVRKKINDHES